VDSAVFALLQALRLGGVALQPVQIADAWGNALWSHGVESAICAFLAALGGRDDTTRSDGWFIEPPTRSSSVVLRSREETVRWNRDAEVYYSAHKQIEHVARQFVAGRLSFLNAISVLRKAGQDVVAHFPQLADRPNTFADLLEKARSRKPRRPELASKFTMEQAALDRIGRAGEENRWYVALAEVLRAAIHVQRFNRPGAFACVEKAHGLTAGGVFPDRATLENDLTKLAGATLGKLTSKARGGRCKRSIGAVIGQLRKMHVQTLPDWQIVQEAIDRTGVKSTIGLSKVLKWSQRRIAAARQTLGGAHPKPRELRQPHSRG
jgi:hypothetical protein